MPFRYISLHNRQPTLTLDPDLVPNHLRKPDKKYDRSCNFECILESQVILLIQKGKKLHGRVIFLTSPKS